MFIDTKGINEITSSICDKFKNFNVDFTGRSYIMSFVCALNESKSTYDDIDISGFSVSENENPLLAVSFFIQNIIYKKLCVLANTDDDVLLQLVEEKMKIASMPCRKYNFSDNNKKEDFLMEVFSCYDGMESFDNFIIRYFISKIKGVPFKMKEVVEERTLPVEQNVKSKRNSLKKKKTKVVTGKVESDDKKVIESKNDVVIDPYSEAKRMCGNRIGSGCLDEFISVCREINLVTSITDNNDNQFKIYVLMRFGYINDSFYTRREIGNITGITFSNILLYEKQIIEYVRGIVNKQLDGYSSYVLNKTFS